LGPESGGYRIEALEDRSNEQHDLATLKTRPHQVIRAQIIGSNQCRAEGFTVRAASPVLTICRKLVEAGYHPDRPLRAYRGDMLCLEIRAIGEAARLEVNAHGSGFIRLRARRAAPPMRKSRPRLYQMAPRLADRGAAR
jgi:hypothetical protein